MISIGEAFLIPARKEGGQRQFGKHDNLRAALMRFFQQADHAPHSNIAAFGLLDRAQLRGSQNKGTGHALILLGVRSCS